MATHVSSRTQATAQETDTQRHNGEVDLLSPDQIPASAETHGAFIGTARIAAGNSWCFVPYLPP